MAKAFANFDGQNMIILGLFIFISFFTGVVWWALKKSNKNHFDYMGNLPNANSNGGLN